MRDHRSTQHERWGGSRERERCLREASRYLQPADAEDAVQEALFRAWRKADAWVSPDGPLPWLLAITRNEALRIRGRVRPEPVDILPECPDEDPELDALPMRLDFDRLLDELPVRDRTLVELYYREDMSQEDVAGRLGIPEGTVKRRLHGARALLRAILDPSR
jgi:RNA polymerase sigma-70 factor (ECF subfamily)